MAEEAAGTAAAMAVGRMAGPKAAVVAKRVGLEAGTAAEARVAVSKEAGAKEVAPEAVTPAVVGMEVATREVAVMVEVVRAVERVEVA